VIKFVKDLQQVHGLSAGTAISSTNKTDCNDITEMLLKVALNTITLTHIEATNHLTFRGRGTTCMYHTVFAMPSAMKMWFEGVVSVEGDNLVVFQYLSASEIWPD
jgi:hypothetical protein